VAATRLQDLSFLAISSRPFFLAAIFPCDFSLDLARALSSEGRGGQPSGCQPNGIRISPRAPSRKQPDQPPNSLGASFRAGCAELKPLENGLKTLNLIGLFT